MRKADRLCFHCDVLDFEVYVSLSFLPVAACLSSSLGTRVRFSWHSVQLGLGTWGAMREWRKNRLTEHTENPVGNAFCWRHSVLATVLLLWRDGIARQLLEEKAFNWGLITVPEGRLLSSWCSRVPRMAREQLSRATSWSAGPSHPGGGKSSWSFLYINICSQTVRYSAAFPTLYGVPSDGLLFVTNLAHTCHICYRLNWTKD